MSFLLPPINHKARDLMGDMATLVNTLNPTNAGKLPAVYQARAIAARMMDADKAIKRIALVIIRMDTGARWLVTFGRKGGWRKEWNFGTNP